MTRHSDERYDAAPEYQPESTQNPEVRGFNDVHAGQENIDIHNVNTVGRWIEIEKGYAVDPEECR